MNVRTLTGSSIQEALAEARRALGDGVVLLESVPARDGQPARITVLADAPAPAAPAAPLGFGYALAQAGTRAAPDARPPDDDRGAARAPGARRTVVRRGLYPDAEPAAPSAGSPGPGAGTGEPSPAALDAAVERGLRPVLARLDALERSFGGPLLASVMRWAAHPLFRGLVGAGMRPETAGALFGTLVEQGFRPDAPGAEGQEAIRWALATAFRDRLSATPPARLTGAVLALGASGVGRTALLLRLALHPSFFGRRRCAVLVAAPDDGSGDDGLRYRDPAGPFERMGLPGALVRTRDDVARALAAHPADQWLIDTPPLPRAPDAAARLLGALHGLLADVVPLDVLLVLDAGRAPDPNGLARLAASPLAPTAAALTRVDEMPGWGHLADVALALPLPVHLIATGPRVPDDLHAYSPGWLAEAVARRLEPLAAR